MKASYLVSLITLVCLAPSFAAPIASDNGGLIGMPVGQTAAIEHKNQESSSERSGNCRQTNMEGDNSDDDADTSSNSTEGQETQEGPESELLPAKSKNGVGQDISTLLKKLFQEAVALLFGNSSKGQVHGQDGSDGAGIEGNSGSSSSENSMSNPITLY